MEYVINTMTNLAMQTGFAFLKPGNAIMIVSIGILISCDCKRL